MSGLGGAPSSFGGFVSTGGLTASGGLSNMPKGGSTGVGSGGSPTSSGGATVSSGGATVNTGGAPVSTGGVATASGGAASACMPYDGTVKADSLIFSDGQGTSTKGMWKGYAYTYTYGKGAVIKPVTSAATSCIKGKALCANGTITPDDGSGAGIGWNINQSGSAASTTTITTGVTFVLKGASANMRVALGPPTGDDYCYNLTAADVAAANTAAGLTLKASDFKQACYDTEKAVAYKGEDVKSIQVSMPGSASGARTFDFCVVDIEPG